MNPDHPILSNEWRDRRLASLRKELECFQKELIAARRSQTSVKAELAGFKSANKNLQEVVLKLSEKLGTHNEEIKSLEEVISERDSDGLEDAKTMDELRKSVKSKDEVLTVTLINLSNARAAQAELRGTDEYTAHKMKQRIAELECLVLQAAVDKQVKRPDTDEECARDIEIADSTGKVIQTGIRFVAPACTVAFIAFLAMVLQAFTVYFAPFTVYFAQ